MNRNYRPAASYNIDDNLDCRFGSPVFMNVFPFWESEAVPFWYSLSYRKENQISYLGQCKECEYEYQRGYLKEKNKIVFSDNLEHLIDIQYKKINPERILDISDLYIVQLGTDEIFVSVV